MSEYAVMVKNLNKKRGKFRLTDINFSLEKGYIMGLVGRMGAGKTTLMNCLINKRGVGTSVNVDGDIGVIMEDMPFLNMCSLDENARIFGGLSERYSEELYKEYLKRVGLSGGQVYNKLSKGEKIKFQLAFAMSMQPSLLILDEPTSGLDVVFRKSFLYMIQEMVAEKMVSVIISTHLTEDLDKVADYIGYIDGGRLLFMRDKNELLEEYKIRHNLSTMPVLADVLYEEEKKAYEW